MLEVADLHAGYGSTEVLRGVSLSVAKGEVVSILGRNGVGKTTLMKSLIGLVRPWSGDIRVSGRAVAGLAPERIARSGLAYVPQGRGIFPKLTVQENLAMGIRARRDGGAGVPGAIYDLFPILAERRSQPGGTLSGGQQQQLALGRALAASPDFLLLDEPSEGIQPNIVQMIGDSRAIRPRSSRPRSKGWAAACSAPNSRPSARRTSRRSSTGHGRPSRISSG